MSAGTVIIASSTHESFGCVLSGLYFYPFFIMRVFRYSLKKRGRGGVVDLSVSVLGVVR